MSLTRWEYQTWNRVSLQKALGDLAIAGQAGWELITVVPEPVLGYVLIMKRPEIREADREQRAPAARAASQRIYIQNLPAWAREEDLAELFSPFGPIITVVVPSDRETESGQGFGFVEMETDDAERAIAALDQSTFADLVLQVGPVRVAGDPSLAGRGQHAYGSGDGTD